MKNRDQLMHFIKRAERMVKVYGWQERASSPYGYPVKVTKLIAELKDYDKCTPGSKEYLLALATGLEDIMTVWEKRELAPKTKVRIIKTGQFMWLTGEEVEMFAELVEVVDDMDESATEAVGWR